MDFAPILDINSNPKNLVIGNRAFGATAGIVTKLGIETMKGLQAQNIISVVKHFPGHGDTYRVLKLKQKYNPSDTTVPSVEPQWDKEED